MQLQLARCAVAREALGFDPQERGLALEPAGVAGERARAADDAMAGNDDRHRIAPDRGADGTARRRQAESARDRAVARRRARRDAKERVPDRALEIGSLQVE